MICSECQEDIQKCAESRLWVASGQKNVRLSDQRAVITEKLCTAQQVQDSSQRENVRFFKKCSRKTVSVLSADILTELKLEERRGPALNLQIFKIRFLRV